MQRSTTREASARVIGLFDQATPTRYVAVYDDETTGPERSTRERAESDYRDANAAKVEIRAAVESYGLKSAVFRAWGDIHKDFKSCIDSKRVCLALDSRSGATHLTSWLGPKALES